MIFSKAGQNFRIKIFYGLVILYLCGTSVYSQSGGNNTYDFLNLTNSARVAALGGKSISIYDDDLNMPFHNPALLNATMDKNLVLNYVNYFAGINYGYVSYAKDLDSIGNFAIGLHYLNYGSFIEANSSGEITGMFRAAEYAFNLIYSHKIDSLLHFGINVKPIFSHLEAYKSTGIAIDAGITYHNPEKLFTAALVLKNMGMQLSTYCQNGEREPLPFEIQAGISQKLQYAPFRFSVVAQNLEKWDLTYKTEKDLEDEIDPFTGETVKENTVDVFFDNLLRHFIVGVEFVPLNSFMLRFGYNYKRRQEMKIESKTAMAGFSWGFGLKISKFHISYGRATYHLAGASNHFSISTNLYELNKKF